jgi:hypothetical protein
MMNWKVFGRKRSSPNCKVGLLPRRKCEDNENDKREKERMKEWKRKENNIYKEMERYINING